jgi:hypothetical protein
MGDVTVVAVVAGTNLFSGLESSVAGLIGHLLGELLNGSLGVDIPSGGIQEGSCDEPAKPSTLNAVLGWSLPPTSEQGLPFRFGELTEQCAEYTKLSHVIPSCSRT